MGYFKKNLFVYEYVVCQMDDNQDGYPLFTAGHYAEPFVGIPHVLVLQVHSASCKNKIINISSTRNLHRPKNSSTKARNL